MEVKCLECQTALYTLAESVIHENHHPRTGESPPSTYVNPCPNPKCSDIPFPHESESEHILMMHEIATLENEDPRLTEIFSLMRPAKPKYGLGFLE